MVAVANIDFNTVIVHMLEFTFLREETVNLNAGNTRGGSITVLLTFCLTGLDYSVLQKKLSVVIQLILN